MSWHIRGGWEDEHDGSLSALVFEQEWWFVWWGGKVNDKMPFGISAKSGFFPFSNHENSIRNTCIHTPTQSQGTNPLSHHIQTRWITLKIYNSNWFVCRTWMTRVGQPGEGKSFEKSNLWKMLACWWAFEKCSIGWKQKMWVKWNYSK